MSEEHGRVVEALKFLAEVDDIPTYLAEHGHRGVPAEMAACPVAVYVRDQTGVDVLIDLTHWRLDDGERQPGGVVPGDVALFIERFDHGDHAELDVIATPERTTPQQNGEPSDG